nr:hypothetical protein Itr_chr10CG10980 [Ipomoea trifida]
MAAEEAGKRHDGDRGGREEATTAEVGATATTVEVRRWQYNVRTKGEKVSCEGFLFSCVSKEMPRCQCPVRNVNKGSEDQLLLIHQLRPFPTNHLAGQLFDLVDPIDHRHLKIFISRSKIQVLIRVVNGSTDLTKLCQLIKRGMGIEYIPSSVLFRLEASTPLASWGRSNGMSSGGDPEANKSCPFKSFASTSAFLLPISTSWLLPK